MEEISRKRKYIIRALLEGEVEATPVPPTQGEIFGEFTKGYSIGKKTTSSQGAATMPMYAVWNNSASGRAAMTVPILNKGYVVTVTDPSLYQLNVYGIVDPEAIATSYSSAVNHVYYQGDSTAVGWKSSDSTTEPYMMIALKRASGSFTSAELENGAEAVFTFTTI